MRYQLLCIDMLLMCIITYGVTPTCAPFAVRIGLVEPKQLKCCKLSEPWVSFTSSGKLGSTTWQSWPPPRCSSVSPPKCTTALRTGANSGSSRADVLLVVVLVFLWRQQVMLLLWTYSQFPALKCNAFRVPRLSSTTAISNRSLVISVFHFGMLKIDFFSPFFIKCFKTFVRRNYRSEEMDVQTEM